MEAGCLPWRTSKTRSQPNSKKGVLEGTQRNFEPTASEYAKDGGKQVVRVLESAAGLIPIPYIQKALQIALKVVEACEEVSAIEQQVRRLQDRVCGLMMAILEHITEAPDTGAVINAGKMIEDEVDALNGVLGEIILDLNDIKHQNRWLLFFFKDVNKTKVDECMDRLTTALEHFNLSNDMNVARSLGKIQLRLEKIQSLAEQVSHQVDNLGTKVDTGFSAMMNVLEEAKFHTTSLPLIRQQMPLKPRIFHGREKIAQEVTQLLINEKTSRVCILGPGGMGKTSLALAVVNSSPVQAKFHEKNRFWVPCIEATSVNLFLQILYTNLRISRDTKDPLEDILYELGASNEPRLILLDNFETTWNLLNGTQGQINDIICRLGQLKHVALLVTMRGAHPPTDDIVWQHKNLPPANAEACRQIFHDINPSAKDDVDVDDLLLAIGYMPFAVTLMATLGKESQSPAKTLLAEWSRAGTDMLSLAATEKSMNTSISLSVNSALIKQNPEALALLATLSMLPAGTTRERLDHWAPSLQSLSRAIAILSKAALLMVSEEDNSDGSSTLFVLPVVQSYMRLHNRIPDDIKQNVYKACCSYVLANRSRPGDLNFKIHAKILAAEDTNIQSIFQSLFSSSNQAVTESFDAFLAFNWYRHDTRPNVQLAMKASDVSRTTGRKEYVAEALFCLGSTYSKFDQYDLSKTYLEEAYTLFRDLATKKTGSKPDVIRRAGQCGLVLVESMHFMQCEGLDILELIKKDFEDAGDKYGKALCLIAFGETSYFLVRGKRALTYLEKAKRILVTLHKPSDLAKCLEVMSRVYNLTHEYAKASEACEQALKLIEGLDSEHLRADITQMFSYILLSMDQHTQALENARISLISHEITGRPLGIAQLWEHIGHIYLHQSKYEDAHAAYQAAFDAWATLGPFKMVEEGKAFCSVYMKKIKQKQMAPNTQIMFPGRTDGPPGLLAENDQYF